MAVGYLKAASPALVPLLAYGALRYLAEGMSWTVPAMVIGLTALPLKILCNWLFMYGSPALGIPALGGVGCGWATTVVMTYSLVVMAVVVANSRLRASNVFKAFSWPQPQEIRRLLVVGVPIGLALLVEVGLFATVGLLVGRLGVETVASHQIAFNVAGIAFMIPLALGMASTIRVGFNVGAGDLPAARLSAWVATATTLSWGFAMGAVMLAFRHPIVGLYTDDPQVVRLAAALLALGALFQVFDSTQATVMGALARLQVDGRAHAGRRGRLLARRATDRRGAVFRVRRSAALGGRADVHARTVRTLGGPRLVVGTGGRAWRSRPSRWWVG